ncbi:MAG: LLM class F420-dependent oxidoreductase, partial [Actinobacteria bacterium]|nr:LLM class F420-dependent oxidoreductase [Actinomycetota bacterium]
WNGFGPPDRYAHKNGVIDDWCAKLDRDPAEVERTAMVDDKAADNLDQWVDAGAQHVILGVGAPFDLDPLQRLMEAAGKR